MIYHYLPDGTRTPFDPATVDLDGCLLCGWPVAMVGVFMPTDDAMRAVVLKLRQHPAQPTTTACVVYGLCADHSANYAASSVDVEARLEALAARVVVQ